MATSGRFSKKFANGKCEIGINWEITERSSTGYYTKITWNADIINNSSGNITIKKGNITGKPFDSDNFSTVNPNMSRSFPAGETTPIYRDGFWETTDWNDKVYHDVYGKATASIELICVIDAYIDGVYCDSISVGGTLELEPFNKIFELTLDKDNVVFGEKLKIEVHNKAKCTYEIEAHMGDVVAEIATGTTGIINKTVNWTVEESLADAIPTATVGFCTIVCNTYDTNTMTFIGSRTYPLTLRIPDNAVPTVKAEIEAERTTLDYVTSSGDVAYENFYLAGFTRINVTSDCTGKLGASIKSILVTAYGHTYSGSNVTTEIIPRTASGNIPITIKVTDSRGFVTTITKQINITAYHIPKIENFAIHRCLEDGTLDDEGDNCLVELKASIKSLLSGKIECNAISASLEVKKQSTGETEYFDFNCPGGINYDGSILIPELAEDACYDITVSVSDKVTDVDDTAYLSTASTILDIYNDGTGMAIGKVAEYPDLFEVDWPTKFNRKVEIKEFPHASPDDTAYGKGDGDNYGHLKLSDSVESGSDESEGTAATPKAVKQAYDFAESAFRFMRKLTSDDDMDYVTDNGMYYYETGNAPKNAPYPYASVIEVGGSKSANTQKFQRATRYGVSGCMSERSLGGTWKAWVQYATGEDIEELKKLIDKALGNDEECAWKPLPLEDGITVSPYGRDVPSYRKIGNLVHIEGIVGLNVEDTNIVIAKLPTGYRPKSPNIFDQKNCEGANIARLKIRENGYLFLERIFKISDGTLYTGKIAWCDIKCSYFVD